jgi:hypothetical protein
MIHQLNPQDTGHVCPTMIWHLNIAIATASLGKSNVSCRFPCSLIQHQASHISQEMQSASSIPMSPDGGHDSIVTVSSKQGFLTRWADLPKPKQ